MTERPMPDPVPDADDFHDEEECPNCGGEGWLYECIDGCCENAEEGCDLCMYRCDWCRPSRPAPGAPAGEEEGR